MIEMSLLENVKIFAGNSNVELAQAICDHLHMDLGKMELFKFVNDNTFCKINESVREAHVFILQSSCVPVNDSVMEMLIMIDALRRASAGRITAIVPYFPYSRSDKKDQPRVPITARLVGDLLEKAGADRIITVDLHAPQIQGFFSIPVDHLTAFPIFLQYFKNQNIDDLVVVAPDSGSVKLADKYAQQLKCPYALIDKRRIGNNDKPKAVNLIGDIEGKNAVIFDDEISTAGSILESVELLKRKGAKDISIAATHGVLCGPAIERIKSMPIKELIVTDTVLIPEEKRIDKIKVLSVASLLGEAIKRIHVGKSISLLFESE